MSKNKKLTDQYPNEGQVDTGQKREMNEDNHFKDHPKDEIAKKYMQFTVHMESLNNVLELDHTTTIEQFSFRIRDLIYASETIR